MAWRFMRQPDGLLALWSDIVDGFTYVNLTPEEAIEVAMEKDLGRQSAKEKVERGMTRAVSDHGGWEASLRTIKLVHGEEAVQKLLEEMKT